MSNKALRVIISGGGTGGHLFPAIAIANALKAQDNNIEILFVGALGKIEMEKVPQAGYKIEGLEIKGLNRSFTIENLKFPWLLLKSLIRSSSIIDSFKPDLAIGVGGFASGPLLYMANKKNIPTFIQEQNSYPGITNKILSSKAKKIFVAYSDLEKYFPKDKIIISGNPVRNDILNIGDKKADGLKHFGLSENKKTIFLTGGSLGARTLNQAVENNIDLLIKNDIQVIWQCGKYAYEAIKSRLEPNLLENNSIKLLPFIDRVDLAYACADIVIARAGASTISELCLVAKPAILVPSPNVAEDHQTKNAMALVNKDAAILIKDSEANEKLISKAIELLSSEHQQTKLSLEIKKIGYPNSVEFIASQIINIVKTEKK